jgi:hypothetical protein
MEGSSPSPLMKYPCSQTLANVFTCRWALLPAGHAVGILTNRWAGSNWAATANRGARTMSAPRWVGGSRVPVPGPTAPLSPRSRTRWPRAAWITASKLHQRPRQGATLDLKVRHRIRFAV